MENKDKSNAAADADGGQIVADRLNRPDADDIETAAGRKNLAYAGKMRPMTDEMPAMSNHTQAISDKYPWFDVAVIACANGQISELPMHILLKKNIHIMLQTNKRPSFIPHSSPASDEPISAADINITITDEFKPTLMENTQAPVANEPKPTMIDIIDCFIEKGEHIVKITDRTPEFIAENSSDDLPEDDELVTEELAEVYLNQGLFCQAKSLYEKLSLLYPKKSVYFAEIIEKTERGERKTEIIYPRGEE